jgi:hypothetical protein
VVHWYKSSCCVHRWEDAMKAFVRRHDDRIHGGLSCVDRMLLCSYLPIMSGWSMAQRLRAHEIDCGSVKPFLDGQCRTRQGACTGSGPRTRRPFEYVSTKLRKQDAARKLAERDGIDEGLVCVFSSLEPCRTFSLRACASDEKKASAKVGRCFRPLHARGLIAKIQRTRQWRVTSHGRNVTGRLLNLNLGEYHFPNVYAIATAA